MDLTDIFGDAPKAQTRPNKQVTQEDIVDALGVDLPEVTDELEEHARKTAVLFDEAELAYQLYSNQHRALIEEAELKCAALAEDASRRRRALEESREALQEAMKEAGLTEIPMRDRAPIYIKTVKGKKKAITLKWLTSKEGLGKQAGTALWKKVPKKPDEKKLVVPKRHDDQPSD